MPDEPTTPRPSQLPAKEVIAGIMVALLAWGVYLASGAYQAAVQQHTAAPVLRALVVLGCTLLFLAFWAVMLLTRRRAAQ